MTTTIYNGNTRQAMHVRSIAYCLRVLTTTAKRRRTTASANDGRTTQLENVIKCTGRKRPSGR